MKGKTFRIVLFTVLVFCILLTVAHVAYAVYAYGNSSIIYFISKELW